MQKQAEQIGFSVTLDSDFETSLDRVIAALKSEGFGVLTEIDVKATLKTKLDVEFRNYRILGACNPPLAYRALQTQANIGLLLPCNVTVMELDNGSVEVSFLDPILMMSVTGNPNLEPVANEAKAKLERAAAALQEG